MRKDLENELIYNYPNKKITKLYKNVTLYKNLLDLSKLEGFNSLAKFLECNGFRYINGPEDKIKQKLSEIFPDRIVSDLRRSYFPLYQNIRHQAVLYNLNIDEYLESLGYTYEKLIKAASVDRETAKVLNSLYGLSLEKIGGFAGVTKETVSNAISDGNSSPSWISDTLDEKIHEIYKSMILNHIFEKTIADITYCIFNNEKVKGFCLLWYTIEGNVNCVFNDKAPEDLVILSEKTFMNQYTSEDYKFLNHIKVVHKLKEEYIFLDDENSAAFHAARRTHKLGAKEYCNYLGYAGCCIKGKDVNTDEHLIEVFEENLINGKVYISSANNHDIYMYASRVKIQGIKGLLNLLGYELGYGNDRSNILNEKYSNELKNYICKKPNYVSLPVDSEIYKNIYNVSKFRQYSFDDYLKELGYERIDINLTKIEKPGKSISAKKRHLVEMETKLKHLSELEKHRSKTEKKEISYRKRNKVLVNDLKDIYDYKCQLCTPHEIFTIKKKDGFNYVEIHHIIPLADEEQPDDILNDGLKEDECLDVLSNLIVVCPNHHKYLHYHHGGLHKLVKNDYEIYLANDNGDKIQIVRNFHL